VQLDLQVVVIGWSSSSSVNPDLLSPHTCSNGAVPPSAFYSMSARNRPITPPQNASNPTSTPITSETSGRYMCASETRDSCRDSANYRLALETSGLFLGAMPPNQFLDEFLPISQDAPKCPNWTGAFTSVGSAGKEVDMYAQFVSIVLVSVSAMPHRLISNPGRYSTNPALRKPFARRQPRSS
jgi:hypothetical protein